MTIGWKKHKNEISQNIVFVFQRRKYVKQVCMNEWMNEAVRVLSLQSSLFMVLWQSPELIIY